VTATQDILLLRLRYDYHNTETVVITASTNANTGRPVSGEQRCQTVQPLGSFGSAPQAQTSSETGRRRQCRKGFPANSNKSIIIMYINKQLAIKYCNICIRSFISVIQLYCLYLCYSYLISMYLSTCTNCIYAPSILLHSFWASERACSTNEIQWLVYQL